MTAQGVMPLPVNRVEDRQLRSVPFITGLGFSIARDFCLRREQSFYILGAVVVLAVLRRAVKYQIPVGYGRDYSASCHIESGRNSVVPVVQLSKIFALIMVWCRCRCNCDHRRLISMRGSAEFDKRPAVFNARRIGQMGDSFLEISCPTIIVTDRHRVRPSWFCVSSLSLAILINVWC